MRSLLFTIAIIFCITIKTVAQVPPTKPDEDAPPRKKSFYERLVYGGGIGAQFGSNTQVNISPEVGYHFTDKFTAGIGLSYIYYKLNYIVDTNTVSYYPPDIVNIQIKNNIYGGNLYAEYLVIPQAFLRAEYGILNMEVPRQSYSGNYYDTKRSNINTLFVGGGYYYAISDRAGFQISLLWDLIDDKYSPYSNPDYRIGFVAGF